MKPFAIHFKRIGAFVFSLFFTGFSQQSLAQCTIVSPAAGNNPTYNINIAINPIAIVPSSLSCPFGYTYNVTYHYNISYSGPGTPDVNTLQLLPTCGSDNLFLSLPISGGSGNLTTTTNPYRTSSDCGSSTPASLGCTSVAPNIFINTSTGSINNQTVSCAYSLASLPVKLMSFDARTNGDLVYLTWTTAAEVQNDHFALQRSTDVEVWETLKNIDGAGDSKLTTKYDYVDRMPEQGMYYYRLQQVDKNGSYAYSNILGVKSASMSDEISLYPNPGQSNHVQVRGLGSKGNWQLKLSGMTGQSLFNGQVNEGSVTLPDVPAGVYYIDVYNSSTGEKKTVKYSKI